MNKRIFNAFTLAEGRQASTSTQVAAKGGQVRSYTLKVSKVSTVSEVSKMSKQGELQSLHSLRPLGEGGRRPDEGADETRHEAVEPKTCNHLFTQSLNHLITSQKAAFTLAEGRLACTTTQVAAKAAFTLAEVLITLAVIGIVAALTLPGLIQNHNEKAWSTAQDVFTKRLEVATRQMNTEEKLAGYDSTMDFVNELKKYIKITRVCDNSEITKCFNKQVIWNEGDEPVDMSAIKNAQSFGLDWDSDTVAVQFANGVNAVIAYNPNATQDPFNNQFSATSNSMAILYDVSGNKNPNTNGKDIGKINVEQLAGVTGCLIPEETLGYCISQILAPDIGYSPMTRAECEQAVEEGKLGITECYLNKDYWTGAVKACGGVQNMPTKDQLAQLANYLYNTDSVSSSGITYKGLDTEKASQFISASPASNYFYVWSVQESSDGNACRRNFYSTKTYLQCLGRNSSGSLAVCLSN